MKCKMILKIAICIMFALTLIFLSGCLNLGLRTGGTTRGNGRMAGGVLSHDGVITNINVIGMPAILNLTSERSSEISYTIDENLRSLLEITHQNGVLTITTRNNASIIGNGITFDIGTDMLEGIIISGATTIDGRGTFNADTFTLDISGAGGVDLDLNVQSMSVSVSGAARLNLSGTADSLMINNDGAAIITARNMTVQDAIVELNGAGSIQVHAEKTLDATVAGVGTITYWGDPVLTQSTVGLASVRRGE